MKFFYLLVAGSRDYDNYLEMCKILDYILQDVIKIGYKIIIVSGGARGADGLAEKYADERGYEKHIMPADWNRYGKRAGYIRNEQMHLYIAENAKRGCICFWDGNSKGTSHNFSLANKYGTPLKVYNYKIGKFLKIA